MIIGTVQYCDILNNNYINFIKYYVKFGKYIRLTLFINNVKVYLINEPGKVYKRLGDTFTDATMDQL